MSRILKRPMFRRGGSTNTGIMSGITDRTNYENGGIDLSGINKERLRGSATAIQSLLNEVLTKRLVADGDFGNLTLSAVLIFQKKAGLIEDGIVGANTYAKLLEFRNAKNMKERRSSFVKYQTE